jgi:hypothetical protein
MSGNDERTRLKADIMLAEFAALRSEIEQRSNAQLFLTSLNVTAVGAVGAFTLLNDDQIHLLILLPALCSTLGLLWLDNHNTIRNLGAHIRGLKIINEWPISTWENREVPIQERKKILRVPYICQILILFAIPPIYALVTLPLRGALAGTWLLFLYILGLLPFVLFLWYLIHTLDALVPFRGCRRRDDEQPEPAESLRGATMPNGQKYEDRLKSKGHGEDGVNRASWIPSYEEWHKTKVRGEDGKNSGP